MNIIPHNKGLFKIIFIKVRCTAFFIMIKFMIALPNHSAVLAGGMLDLATIETATLAADNFTGERTATRFIVFFLLSFFELMLNEVIYLWFVGEIDNFSYNAIFCLNFTMIVL